MAEDLVQAHVAEGRLIRVLKTGASPSRATTSITRAGDRVHRLLPCCAMPCVIRAKPKTSLRWGFDPAIGEHSRW